MCGRYQFDFSNPEHFQERFDIEGSFPKAKLKSRYNIAPSQELPVIIAQSPNSVVMMLWGLIPFWEKGDKPKGLPNVRDDSIRDKGWANKYIEFSRCLVPASGFYEWKKTSDGKVPYYIRLKSKDYFAFAGMFSEWKAPSGKTIKAYTLITTEPNELMKPIHNRMPVILHKDDEDDWLNPDNAEKQQLIKYLKPYPTKEMEAYPISTRVNKPMFDDPDIIKPVEKT